MKRCVISPAPGALVTRDGMQKRIAGRDVVRGDILVLSEGDRVPADAVLLFCSNFSVEESLLTGESVSVNKIESDDANIAIDRPGGNNTSFLYSGTLVLNGQGIAKVSSTGIYTDWQNRKKPPDSGNRKNTFADRNGKTREKHCNCWRFALSACCHPLLCDTGEYS